MGLGAEIRNPRVKTQVTTQGMSQNGLRVSSIYRIFFLYVEPLSAVTGAYYAHFQPHTYLRLTHASSAPKSTVPISTRTVLSQLANLYFLFAINEALVLRSTADLKVWKAVLFCLLVADIGHLYSVHHLGLPIYLNVLDWNAIDFGNIGFVYVGAFMRLSFLLVYGRGSSSPKTAGIQ